MRPWVMVRRIDWSQPWGSWAFTLALVATAVALAVYAYPGTPVPLASLLLFTCFSAIAELLPVDLPAGRGRLSVGVAVNAAAVLALGPYWGAVAAASGIGLANWVQELALDVLLFNAAQMAVAAGVAGAVWVSARGASAHIVSLPDDLPAFLLFMGAYLGLNAGLVTAGISLAHRIPFWKTVADNVRWAVPNMLLLGALGLLMAGVYQTGLGSVGVALFWVPMLLARYAFQQYLELQRIHVETIHALVAALEARDPLTCGHSQRVSAYATAVAEAMRLSQEQVEAVRYAGLLHDIGKIGIRDSILNKVGRLTEEEYVAIKMHPVIGAEMLGRVSFLTEVSRLIRSHHERFDGRGYPDGLQAEAIPLGSRILAVVDAFDVMVTGRPYKPAMTVVEAIAELERGRGTQFDPAVVDAFVAWLRTQAEPPALAVGVPEQGLGVGLP